MAMQLDLTLQTEEGGDISNFNTNGEWDLLGKVFLFLSALTVFVCSITLLCASACPDRPSVPLYSLDSDDALGVEMQLQCVLCSRS